MTSSKAPIVWLGECYGTTRADLWERMTGRASWPNLDDELAIEMGNAAEPVCARRFAKRTGFVVREPAGTWRHASDPNIIGHVDREVVMPDGRIAPLECKWTESSGTKEWGPDGTDQMPIEHLVQIQHQLACDPPGGKAADVAFGCVIIGRNEFRIFEIARSQRFIAALLAEEQAFAQLVRTHTPPEPRLPQEWRTIYRDSRPGKVVEADRDILQVIARREAVKARCGAMESELEALECQLLAYARDADAITVGGDPVMTMTTTKSGARPFRLVQKNWTRARNYLRSSNQ